MQSFLKKALQDKRGELYIRACILIIIILIIFILLFNYTMITVQARAQRKGAIQTLDQYTQLNAIEIFDSIKSENDTTEELDPDLFVTLLCSSQGLVETDGVYCAYSSDNECLYKVSDIRMSFLVDNTSKIKVSYTLTVPLSFAGNTMWIDVPVTISTSINPKFESSGTLYTVKHWKESPNGEYILDTTWSLTGPANSYVTPPTKTYKGFTSPAPQTVVILEDRSTVVNYYYGRMRFNVTVKKDAGIESVSGSGRYFYGDTVVINATVSDGYTWGGWIDEQNVLPDASAITNTIEVTENITLIATTKDANNKSVHAVTYDFGINQGINAGTYFDTGYKIDWDKDFEVTTTFNIPARGQRYLVVGNYDGTSNTALNIEVTAGDQIRVNLGASGVHDKRYGVIPAGEEVAISFFWDASANTYTITGHSSTVDFTGSGTYDMSGTSTNGLRVGACDYRSGAQPFGDVYIAGFTATQEVSEGFAYGDLPAVTRTGYTFTGWFDAEGNQITSSTVVTADRPHTLTAQGTTATYKVTLDNQSATTAGTAAYYYQYGTYYLTSQGGRGWMYADQALTQPLATITPPTKTNELFGGYYTGKDAAGTLYIDGNGYFIDYGHCNVASDVTLYADWIQKFSVTWANWDGTVLETQQIFPGNMPAYTGPTPTRSPDAYNHYTFTGWSPTIQIVEANVIYTAQYGSETHNWGTITYEWSDDHEHCTASATCQTCTYHLVDQGTVEKSDYRAAHCEVNERWKHTAEFTYFAADSCDTWHYGQDALGHLMGEWTRSDEPCCETEGEDIRYCQRDGCTHSETRVVAPTGHDWGEWIETTAPTCTTKGEDTRSCQDTCDDGCCKRTETREVAALGHLMGDWYTAVEPWCETSGYDERDCQRQGCSHYETSYLAPLGHIWPNSWERLRDPCCNTEGEDVRECLRDSRHKQYRDVQALGDRYGGWVTTADPCCELEGEKTRYCQNGVCTASCGCCNYSETETLPALGHNWSDWEQTIAPWCETEGEETRYCKNGCTHGCCEPETRSIPALGHQWPAKWVKVLDPCCNREGLNRRVCLRDSSHNRTTPILAKGDSWGAWITTQRAYCYAEGKRVRYCQNNCDPLLCGCCLESQTATIPKCAHECSWVTTVEATCANAGQKDYVCWMCDGIFDDPQEIPKLAHSNVEVVNNPNPPNSSQGWWVHYHHCKDCNSFYYCDKYEGCTYPGDAGDWP